METIRFTEKRKTSKWPAIIVGTFLVVGSCFVAYAIKYEDNPRMLGFNRDVITSETNGLENVEQSDAQKLEQAMSLNFEVKDISSIDTTTANFVSNIHLPSLYVDGKELTELNAKIQSEYTTRFDTVKESMKQAESNYSFNVSYTYYENIVGLKKIASVVLTQEIIDRDADKVTSKKVNTYNIDLSSKQQISQDSVVIDILGKEYKDILKTQVKEYIITNKYATESSYNYEITGLENFYIQDGTFHIVFNGDSDSVAKTSDVIDIKILNNEEAE